MSGACPLLCPATSVDSWQGCVAVIEVCCADVCAHQGAVVLAGDGVDGGSHKAAHKSQAGRLEHGQLARSPVGAVEKHHHSVAGE